MASKLDEMRKKIVATKEGGAITGEERIREKTSQLYGAIVFYDGRPADYYIARIESLSHERQDVVDEFQAFVKGLQIPVLTREAWEKTSAGSDGGAGRKVHRRKPQGRPWQSLACGESSFFRQSGSLRRRACEGRAGSGGLFPIASFFIL